MEAEGTSGWYLPDSLGASRVPFALAEDGMIPKWLVKVNPRYGTPWVAIVVAGAFHTIFATNAFAFRGVGPRPKGAA